MKADSFTDDVDRLEAASMKLTHAVAMADVMHDFDFRDIPGGTLQNYVHGLRDEISAAKDLLDDATGAVMRSRLASRQSTAPDDSTRTAAVDATFEISSLGDRIRAETTGASPREDEGLVIRSHARRITQLSDAPMRFLADGAGDGLADAGLVAAGTDERAARLSQ